MKLSELLVLYATETAQNKVTTKTAQQFLKDNKISSKKYWMQDETGTKTPCYLIYDLNHLNNYNDSKNPEIYRQIVKQIKNDSK